MVVSASTQPCLGTIKSGGGYSVANDQSALQSAVSLELLKCKGSNLGLPEPAMEGAFAACQPRGWLEARLLNEHRSGPIILPGAWAMGEGLLLDMDNGVRPSRSRTQSAAGGLPPSASNAPSSSVSVNLQNSFSRMAEGWTSSVGSYLNDIAAALTCSGGTFTCASEAANGRPAPSANEKEPELEPSAHPDMRDESLSGGDFCSCIIRVERRSGAVPPPRANGPSWTTAGHQKAD